MHIYINSFYSPRALDSSKQYKVEEDPIMYKGYCIFHRLKSQCPHTNIFDIVKDGVCIGMMAGINGAKRRIDSF